MRKLLLCLFVPLCILGTANTATAAPSHSGVQITDFDFFPLMDSPDWELPRQHPFWVHEIKSPIICGRQTWFIDSATLTLVLRHGGEDRRISAPLLLAPGFNAQGHHSRVATFAYDEWNVFGLTGVWNTVSIVGVELTLLYRNQYGVMGFMHDTYATGPWGLYGWENWGPTKTLRGNVFVRQRGCPQLLRHPRTTAK